MRLLLAFALVLALAACGSDSDDAAAPGPPETVTVTEPRTETDTETETIEPEPEPDCSTAGVRPTLPEQDLPEPVAEVRQRVFDAAVACDYETLEEVALEEGEGFTFSFGAGPDDSAAAHWRALEESGVEEPMRVLATILTLTHTRNESGSYAWPSAYQESPGDADWQALADADLYPQELIDRMREQGSYLGYRTAITAEGDWQFFVAGD